MHVRLAEIVEYLDGCRAALLAAVDEIPPDERDRRPSPERWSVGEILDHLYMVEAGSARLLAHRLMRAREAGLGPEHETSSLLACMDHLEIDRSQTKLQAPEPVRPRDGSRAEAALADLTAARAVLMETLRAGDGFDLTSVTARHATLGEINVYQWAVFVGKHELRHVEQVRATAAALGALPPGARAADATA
jgi:hypothetical protein